LPALIFIIKCRPAYLVPRLRLIIIYNINFTNLSIIHFRYNFFRFSYNKRVHSYIHMFKVPICILFLALSCLTAAAPYAETIYSWTDENGVRHMTNIQPSDATGKVEIIQLKPIPHQTFTPPSLQKDAAAAQTAETPIAIHRDHVIVPTTLIHKNVTIEANLLLDTGSTNIALHKEVARHLSLKKSGKGFIQVAGGKMIEADVVKFDSVTVGPKTQKNLFAGIIEHQGDRVPYDGLLGMNFLKNFVYTIDFDNQVLRWSAD